MKKIATAAISLTLLMSAWLPAIAQRSKLRLEPEASPTSTADLRTVGGPHSAKFGQVAAFSDGRGVLVQWQMESEMRNSGFYVYRFNGKGMERVSNVLILGAGLRRKDQTLQGETYQRYDPHGTPGTIYVIQSIGLDGSRIASDPFSSRSVTNLAAVSGKTSEEYEAASLSSNGTIETTISSPEFQAKPSPDLATHRLVVSKPGAKIAVKSEGLYRVTRTELQAAGFNLSSNSANWRLFMEGVEQSIIVGTNDQYIEFYGRGRDDAESDTRVYYLVADTVSGKRIRTNSLQAYNGALSTTYQTTLEMTERTTYNSDITNGDTSNYYGPAIQAPLTESFIINLSAVDLSVSQNYPVTLKLFGLTPGPHVMSMVINGHNVGTVSADGQFASYSGQKSVPSSFFVEGPNTIDLSSGSPGDVSYFDSVTVTYPRKYQADGNRLRFGAPGRKAATISGFSSPDIRVFDTTSDGQPVEIGNLPVVQNGCSYSITNPAYRGRNLFFQGSTPDPRTAAAGNWNVTTDEVTLADHRFFTGMKGRITTTGTLPGGVTAATDYYVRVTGCNTVSLFDTYADATNLASTTGRIDMTSTGSGDHTITPSSVLQAVSVTQNVPSTLSTVNHNANLVIISYGAPDFMAAANTWANYRRAQGFTVEVVDVADIYDEYSYGSLNSAAIKSFLSSTRSWNTPPQYVLLIGDATYDPRNYEGFGFDLVPSKFFDSDQTGETVSDDALVDFDNDGLADISIGRVPARTASDITTIFNKTVAFETAAQQSLNRGGICAYDIPSQGFDFSASCTALRQQMPGTMPFVMIDRSAPGAQTTLINEINNGRYIVNYSGHGSTGVWSNANFFAIGNVPQLTNAANQSIFTMLTCLNGYFIRVDADSLAEALLKSPNGGAVVAWASTADTQPDIQLVMGKRFYEQVTVANIKRMGDLVRDAKEAIPFDPTDVDVRYSWVLLGDPMLKIRP